MFVKYKIIESNSNKLVFYHDQCLTEHESTKIFDKNTLRLTSSINTKSTTLLKVFFETYIGNFCTFS